MARWGMVVAAALAFGGHTTGPVLAGGDIAARDGGYSNAGPPPPPAAAVESEASEYVRGDPYGRRDYFQDGNRRGGQFGPGYYAEGYYYPRQQYPDYAYYDARRSKDSVWGRLADTVIVPFIPTDEELARLEALRERLRHRLARDDFEGGRYDEPLK